MTRGFNRAILTQVGHRPWRMPEAPWLMTQTWNDLLFAHWPDDTIASFTATYRPAGPVFEPREGSLEHFLTERYCLYNIDHDGMPYRLEIHHPPWPLQTADAEFVRNGMAEANGVTLPDVAPILHFAKRQDMVAWAPARLS